jgi:hypothetical protein
VLSYIGLAIALLKFVSGLMNYVDRQAAMKSGADAEIAKISAAILQRTAAGKKMMEKVNAMSDADVDAGLRGLEPK